jgi:carboxyl-terminal processing protease
VAIRARAILLVLGTALLAGCGGGSDRAPPQAPPPVDTSPCSLADQKTRVLAHLQDRYLFRDQMPAPDPATFPTIQSYFDALLVHTDAQGQPLDRWSYVQDSLSYNRVFTAGTTVGYGLGVAGRPEDPAPIRIRYIDPGSPADQAGLTRGMVVDRIDGRLATDLQATQDFSLLTSTLAGTTLNLEVRDSPAAASARTVVLQSAGYALQPVDPRYTRLITLTSGRQIGLMFYRSFLQVADLMPTLQQFRAANQGQGIDALILDLRYNGGGYLTTARTLASDIAGSRLDGQVFVELLYNSLHSAQNTSYRFTADPAVALNLPRLYVLTGRRTCSASELIINGLSPYLPVIQIGATTCGKPYGFQPVDICGNTFSAVQFSTRNSLGQGDYTRGLNPTCTVADDYVSPPGDAAEPLTAAALTHLQTGACPAVVAGPPTRQALSPRRVPASPQPAGVRSWLMPVD